MKPSIAHRINRGRVTVLFVPDLGKRNEYKVGLHRFLVSVSISGEYQQFMMASESVDHVIQVPILFFVHYEL